MEKGTLEDAADEHRPERPILLAVDQELGLDRWLAVRRGLRVRPVARLDAEPGHPHGPAKHLVGLVSACGAPWASGHAHRHRRRC